MSSANTNLMVKLPFNIPGQVYCGPLPGKADLDGFALELTNKKISTVVMLASAKECSIIKDWYVEKNIKVIHFPIADSKIPTDADNFAMMLNMVEDEAQAGNNIYMHCRSGIGRTSMAAACLAKKILNITGQEAINFVKIHYPNAAPNTIQKAFICNGDALQEISGDQPPQTIASFSSPSKQVIEFQSPKKMANILKLPGMSLLGAMIWHELPFELKGKIYRTGMPGATFLPEWSKHLKEKNVTTIVVLAPQEEIDKSIKMDLLKWYQENGFKTVHLPIEDCGIPQDLNLFNKVIDETQLRAQSGENIAIHCRTGKGRTGMFSTALVQQISHIPFEDALKAVSDLYNVQLASQQLQFLKDLHQDNASSSSSSSSDAKEKEEEEVKEKGSDNDHEISLDEVENVADNIAAVTIENGSANGNEVPSALTEELD